MQSYLSRRRFLVSSGLSMGSFLLLPSGSAATYRANEKVDIGFVGVANRGGANLEDASREKDLANVVALCDVDSNSLADAAKKHPGARTYADFRQMLEKEKLDAVLVATPDHTHAVASAAALHKGCHLYCEKPLTRTVAEARAITRLAADKRAVTQLGTQIHAGNNYRRVVELIQSGTIGAVKEVHVWVGATYGGMPRPTEKPPVPPNLNWDLWLGPVEFEPYSPEYAPFKWRNWWAFGGGSLADFGCHFMDLPHWALELRQPDWVEPVDGPPVDRYSTPPWLIARYHHPARKARADGRELPAVTLLWYHGGKKPSLLDEEQSKYYGSGVYFVGEHGCLLADYTRHVLLPEEKFKGRPRPVPFIPNSQGHHKEWLLAIRGQGNTTCNFNYSGPLTESALLGNVAYRVGRRVEWNVRTMRVHNCPEAQALLRYQYRKGWHL